MFVIDYDCMTAAGLNKEALSNALTQGRACFEVVSDKKWSRPVAPGGLVCQIPFAQRLGETTQDLITKNLQTLTQNIFSRISPQFISELASQRVGIFFASTKGFIEDFVYSAEEKFIRHHPDPFFAITENFKKLNPEINFVKSLSLSNACCSSHVALEFAQELFESDNLDYAFVLAADLVGPFVYQGFNSLKVLSHTRNKPFSGDRDGLQLGEALSVILLSKSPQGSKIRISKVSSDTEGSSITRPSVNGQGLVRTLKNLNLKKNPDFIVAHGTGTIFNDLAEDQALGEFLSELNSPSTSITNTKWCTGHTLGASGSVDLIAACEILKTQKIFSIGSLQNKDPKLKMNYLLAHLKPEGPFNSGILTSLGFGGVHASLSLERVY